LHGNGVFAILRKAGIANLYCLFAAIGFLFILPFSVLIRIPAELCEAKVDVLQQIKFVVASRCLKIR
jgi:hypothetical protein